MCAKDDLGMKIDVNFVQVEKPGTWCEEVIITHDRRGDGLDSPYREILQVFRKDGTLLAEARDPFDWKSGD